MLGFQAKRSTRRHAEPQSDTMLVHAQVVAMQGLACLVRPRESSFLDVAASLPEAQPLIAAWLVVDVCQTVAMASLRHV